MATQRDSWSPSGLAGDMPDALAMAMGASGVYAVAENLGEVDASLADPVPRLTDRAARVARTWSPSR